MFELVSVVLGFLLLVGIILLTVRGLFARETTQALARVRQREDELQAKADVLEQRLSQMEQDPKVASILKQNSLTAREYLVGVPTLRMALMAAQGVAGPTIVASPANVTFAKANLAQLKPKMDQADGLGRR